MKIDRVTNILEHMLDDALDAVTFAAKAGSYDAFLNDRACYKAIVMSIINIGELTKRLPDDFKVSHQEIAWRQVAAMRNYAVHGYHELDDGVIWETVTKDIPRLLEFLRGFCE